ncbi:cytochrome c [Methylomonas koyamae]|uniref:cytochrome c n=1 Tax=Methylomonas koyamae TaxID=702114 RepID=UPI0028733171|nr:cytochrome c [Methylomonas koyamae]WNB74440.1 cytochrome c [Methylomonas koyamae]
MKLHRPLAAMALSALAACEQPPAAKPAELGFKPVASLQELMLAVIDPNIDFVWNSVASITSTEGEQERRPTKPEDWEAVRQHALVVAEAANLLLIDRPVAKGSINTASGGAELSALAIHNLIQANREQFQQRAVALQDASRQLLAAIDQQNADELERAGGVVEQACEQCHSQFWYPGDKRPK